jgi:hypothetical protein
MTSGLRGSGHVSGHGLGEAARHYNAGMSAAKPKASPASPKTAPPAPKQNLARGLPGTSQERAEQRRRFAREHRETLRRLGK